MASEVGKNLLTENLQELISKIWEGGLPTALWRLPNEKKHQLVFSKSKEKTFKKTDFEELTAGFVFAPYEKTAQKTIYIKGDFNICIENFETVNDPQVALALDILKDLPHENDLLADNPSFSESISKIDFIENVNSALANIQKGQFEKVVLSRQKVLQTDKPFKPLEHYQLLTQKYPKAFVSMVYLPWSHEIWIGATPEKLVEQDANGIFRTMSLAGTQSSTDTNGQKIEEKNALWSQKEIEEQALVSRYIINCFKKIRVREYKEIGPKTINAGNLLHLQSTFEVDTKEINFPQIGSVMLDLLHPTSAVCGMPKDKAAAFIAAIETHNREYYSGFLGPVNINGSSNLYVNLRTLKLSKGQITLYAGCGITADSDAEKEWTETEIKMQTVLPFDNFPNADK